jgi:hypothetical protein
MTMKRSLMNDALLGLPGADYKFIDHAKDGGFGEQNPASWTTPYHQCIDAQGYVNTAAGQNKSWTKLFYVPPYSEYSGNWVLSWSGNGRFDFGLGSGTITVSSHTGADFAQINPTQFSGTDCSMTFTIPGNTDGRIFFRVDNTDSNNVGAWFKNFKYYRADQAADLAAGKVWNPVFKNKLIELNPDTFRLMDSLTTNDCLNCRWEYRTKVDYNGWTPGGNGGPQYFPEAAYPDATGTNIYSVAAIGTTPASLTHGEIAHVRFPNAIVRGGGVTVTAVTRANPAVATATAHGYLNGDKVNFYNVVGMVELLDNEYTLANVTTNTFELQGINSTAYGVYVSGTCALTAKIDIGGRGSKPMNRLDGYGNIAIYPSLLGANTIKTLIYDKPTDSWLVYDGSGGWGFGIPVEILTQLFVELAAEMPAGKGPINPWFNIPHMALRASDPDYSVASDYVKKFITFLRDGDGTYGPLPSALDIYLEYSNEWWNALFNQSQYLARRGFLRWGGSRTDFHTFGTLRAILSFNDAVAAYGTGSARIKRVMGLQAAGLGGQSARWDGNATLTGDALWPGGVPANYYDDLAVATYLDDGSGTAALEAAATAYAGGDASQIDVANNIFKSNSIFGSGWFMNTMLPVYKTVANTYNLGILMYEGAWGPPYTAYSATAKAFFDAIKADRRWAYDVLLPFWKSWVADSRCSLPAWFDFAGSQTWSVWYPDIYAANQPAWGMMVAFNAPALSLGLQVPLGTWVGARQGGR